MGYGTRTYNKGKKAYKFGKKHQNTAMKALKLAQQIKRMVNVEYKLDYANSALSSGDTVSWTGSVANLCQPPQGDGVTSRDGDSIKTIRLSGRLFITQNASATDSLLRVIIFRGKNENRTVYAPTDVLYSSTGLMIFNGKEHENRFRTKTLYDKTFSMSDTGKSNFLVNLNLKLDGHITFGSGSTSIENGGVYMLLVSNEQTNFPKVAYTLKTSYTDN